MIAMRCERCGGSYEISGNIWSKVGLAAYELNECVSWEEFDDYRDLCPDCMKDFERWVSGAEEKQTGWISVKDRLPDGGTVLATDGSVVITAPSSSVTADGPAITHWMPLPEPPGDVDAQD